MTKVEGKVAVVSGKPWNSVTLYSFKLEDNDRWYRLGRNKPPFEKGATVSFSEKNGNVLLDSLVMTGSLSDAPPAEESTPDTPAATNVGDRMRYQAARRDAANVVVAALHTDALPWATNVAKGKKLDLLTEYIEQVTKTLLDQEDRNASK